MIELKIVTPRGVYTSLSCQSVHLKSSEGEFTVLPHHMPIITDVVPCRLSVKTEGGDTLEYAMSTGFMQFAEDKMLILADAIEGKGEIDLERAQAAYKRARERLDKKDSHTNMRRAELSLQRAINRIHIAQ
ncbi:ATP synthase F1 subunit epsilon [uncultured Faecalibaculum sp.]|uniref:ATP synthase F1 subunit epsilon n=1 Tax=uncultured Faecalibaculum sp. TaxID=1729681 RepID=UPI0025E9A7DA|nr:ATP synthase F1 subunit epsilon [uncultured Faecalibaculum sp.]